MRPFLHRFSAVGAVLLFALLCTALLAAPYLRPHGSTLVVTSTNDNGPGTLRQAIADAVNGDTIQFDPALNGLIIGLSTGELAVAKSLTITGPGPDQLAVSGSTTSRIFHILSGHTVGIEGLTIMNGHAQSDGAGILNQGTLSLGNSTVRSNVAATGGGTISGGGIANFGAMTITNSMLIGGNGALVGGAISNDGTMMITNSMISGNWAPGGGGGIASSGTLTIVNSTVSGNDSSHGGIPPGGFAGGIYVDGGSLDLIQSTVSDNLGALYGGGIQGHDGTITITDSIISANRSGEGAGIQTDGTATVDIHNSTIAGNVASWGAGISSRGGPLIISNSTVSGNSASSQGGGIGIGSGGATITNCTISVNTAPSGGVSLQLSGPLQIGNTILNAGSSNANIFQTGTNMITSLGYNLSSDDAGGFLTGPGDLMNTDPMLGPLQNNGGPTFTHELLLGSPAINRGDPNFTPPPLYDQRGVGYDRVIAGRIDIGSFEVQSAQPTPTPGPATHFAVVAPGAVVQYFSFDLTVTALDQFNNTVTNYTGIVHFTSTSAGNGTHLPADSPLTNGTGTFLTRLGSPGNQTVTATDTNNPSITGTSNTILVIPEGNSPTPSQTPTATATGTPSPTPQPTPTCPQTLTQSTSFTITSGNSVSCNNGTGQTENSYWRAFNMAFFNGGNTFPVSLVSFGIESVNNPQTITVRLYTNNGGAFPAGTRTLLATRDISVTSAVSGAVISVDFGFPIVPAGTEELVMELFTPDGTAAGNLFFVGSNAGPETGPSYLSAPACGITTPTTTSALGFPNMHIVFGVDRYCEGTPPPPPTPTATATATATVTPIPTATPTPSSTPSTAQLANLSTRLRVETDDLVGLGGFIITGAGSLQVVIRGMGPSLGQFGVPDFLADPTLEVHDISGGLLIQNDNWQDDPIYAAQIISHGLAPSQPAESAVIITLEPGAYTAIVAGKNGGTGIGLVEIYNVDNSVPVANIELGNTSTRGFVQTGDNVMIGGFIVTGSGNTNVAVRGIGPSLPLPNFEDPLRDPILELHDANGALLISNDNWQDDPVSAAQLTAHGLALQDPLESGIFISLPPSLYTAILAGKNGGTGIALVEIYNVN